MSAALGAMYTGSPVGASCPPPEAAVVSDAAAVVSGALEPSEGAGAELPPEHAVRERIMAVLNSEHITFFIVYPPFFNTFKYIFIKVIIYYHTLYNSTIVIFKKI